MSEILLLEAFKLNLTIRKHIAQALRLIIKFPSRKSSTHCESIAIAATFKSEYLEGNSLSLITIALVLAKAYSLDLFACFYSF